MIIIVKGLNMKYEVYLDSIFFIQFVMNYCVLMLAATVMRLVTKRIRIVMAALIGAFGSCLLFVPLAINGLVKGFLVFAFFSVIMTGIAFRVRGSGHYICMLLSVVSALFLFGGITQWLMMVLGGRVSIFQWIAIIVAVYGMLRWVIHLYRKQKSVFLPVSIRIETEDGQKEISVVALQDSGNRLRELSTGKGVCVLESGVLKISEDGEYRVLFRSLGNEADSMKAQIIPKMIVHTKEGDKIIQNVMLAFYQGKISQNGSYHMILHPEYLKSS